MIKIISIQNYSINYMIFYIFNELFYDILRTQQQLGYDVSFETDNNGKILGVIYYISSSKYDPDQILERINKFIVDYDLNKEQNFTDENFENYKKAMLVDLMEKPLTLDAEMSRDLNYIFDRTYKFETRENVIKYVNEKLNKKDVIDYFNKYIFHKAKRLEVALYKSTNKEEVKDDTKMDIEDDSIKKEENEIKEDKNIDTKKNDDDDEKNIIINDYVLPSYQNVEKIIIKDIADFHRQCVYYDNEFY